MSNYVLILTEGEVEEVHLVNNLNKHYLKNEHMHIISFKTNIYALFSQLKQDDFETDIIEILKEKNVGKDILCGEISVDDIDRDTISEIYLLFDYDAHHYAPKASRSLEELKELISHFDNETEQGKLYLSYPMVEAISYHNLINYHTFNIFVFPYNSGVNKQQKHFKKIRHPNVSYIQRKTSNLLTKDDWENIFQRFLLVIHHTMDGVDYSKIASDHIFEAQLQKIEIEKEIIVISTIPSLIIEYFGRRFYDELVEKIQFENSQPEIIQLNEFV